MENDASRQTRSPIAIPEDIRDRLAGPVAASDDGAIRIIAASSQNWPELAQLGVGEAALGEDGLIRVALWSASKCCATLMGTRRASLLLSEGAGMTEIRCLVMAIASLATPRPLSGFLLKPVEFQDGHASRNGFGSTRPTPKDIQSRRGETRLALFHAFPVDDDGENAPPDGIPPDGDTRTGFIGRSGARRTGPVRNSSQPVGSPTKTGRK